MRIEKHYQDIELARKTTRDIYYEANYEELWDVVILEALEEGCISHAKVQKVLGGSYAKAGLLIDLVIKYGYFDSKQKAKIDSNYYKNMINKRGI